MDPFVGGGGDERGDPFEILNPVGHRAERVDFKRLAHRAVIEDERDHAQNGAERDTAGGDFPVADRQG